MYGGGRCGGGAEVCEAGVPVCEAPDAPCSRSGIYIYIYIYIYLYIYTYIYQSRKMRDLEDSETLDPSSGDGVKFDLGSNLTPRRS